jgi:DNA-binding LacI/PurR family transcriptional regulator
MARSLRCRTTKTLGLIISAATNPIFGRIVLTIEQKAHELGYDLLLAHSLNLVEREEAVIRRMLGRNVDGLLLCPVYRLAPTAPIYQELLKRGVKTVVLGQRAPFCSQFVNVESDDLEASKAMTKHLLSLGHKRIAFFAGPTVSPANAERLEGYRRALREANLELDDRLIFDAGSTIEEGEKTAAQMRQEAIKPTAIQAVNDLVAIGAANHLLNNGLRIPDDISIAGFGNILVAEFFRVPLTTVRQPKMALGVAAMELMAKLLRGESAESMHLPAALVSRQSTAGPKAG